ncbi:AP-4 complex accessory subunit RUSC2-like isoform X2 [Rhincodon typus]|uniref:AP-4 complex accessory subunit RUSC2-like isoform X2 n=1 Tax=Rhincodon typus TaxID=259920 RepID=UPI00202E441A|nr:AP-4 complex accessory subunit RUSC2-like isoform X2 [Rhincodon typus]
MDSPPKLTGETLIVHHIPLVHCQVPDRKRCSMGKRPNPFYHTDLGITRTTSLPERDLLQKETLLYSSLIQASCLPPGVPHETEGRLPDSKETNTSDQHNSLIFNENNDQEISYNSSFHPQNSNINNSPFVLHEQPFHLHGAEKSTKQWSSNIRQGIIEGQEEQTHKCDCKKSNRIITSKQASADLIELPMCNCAHDSTSTLFFDCNQGLENTQDGLFGKQDLLDSRKCSCSSSDIQQSRSCVFSDQSEVDNQHMTYNSDSSCNSSDGVLVNFTAIYNKMKTQSKSNLSSGNMSHDSSYCSHSEMGAFYLDLQSSPSEPKNSCDIHSGDSAMQTCLCHQQCSPAVDDNCNSYHLPCENMPCSSENSDYTACFQSQARLVVATQNYYKLVTCDLSSQSTPSPAGSSITSCSEDHAKSTSPSQPTEYYLFRQPEDKIDIDQCFQEEPALEATEDLIEGQVYVNVASNTSGRQRSRSYDRNLDKGPSPRLGSLERMYSCPGKLSDSHTGTSQRSPPRRVTSFAEIARTRKRSGNSPPLKTSGDSSIEFSPILENQKENNVFVSLDEECCHNLPGGSSPKMDLTTSCAAPFIHRFSNKNSNASLHDRAHLEGYGPCYNGEDGSKLEPVNPLHQQVEKNASFDSSTKMEGGGSEANAVIRYSKEQRPTTLPIQPFILHHPLSKQIPRVRPLQNHSASSVSCMYSIPSSQLTTNGHSSGTSSSSGGMVSLENIATVGKSQNGFKADENEKQRNSSPISEYCSRRPVPDAIRPSPLGSYSPVKNDASILQSGKLSSSAVSPERNFGINPPRSRSCPLSANLISIRSAPVKGVVSPSKAHLQHIRDERKSPKEAQKKEQGNFQTGQSSTCCSHQTVLPTSANVTANGVSSHLDHHKDNQSRSGKAALFNHVASGFTSGQSVKQLQSYYSDFFPDYFSLAEKPPAEFCLSPDGTTESISVDLLQKKGLVKAVNTAVDLIVAHFGTSRDPGVKAKLGNSTVSPNVGHLILKYLCPAMKNVLQDGLKAYIPDMIIGQRKNLPWIVIEASTQLGPSTKALNNLFCKISQCSELTSRSTRFNAFIFGLLNIRSLEFWFNHLYNHEDIIGVHYLPTGFLALSHSVCQSLFEELLLLLQPLSLLPFDLDLMFEYHVIQMNMEQQKKKEQLKVKQDLLQSVHSTFQLMRNNGSNVSLGPIQDREDKSEGFTLKGVIARDAVILDKHEDDVQNVEKIRKENVSETKKDKQAGWWYQLMQSSQVYIEGSSEQSMFVNWEKRKKQSTATVLPQLSINTEKKSLREGVPEGAESQPTSELHKLNICGVLSNQAESSEEAAATKEFSKTIQPEYSKNEAKPSWMGSPPESVLHELKNSKVNESTASNNNDPQPGKMPNMDNTESKQGMWLGRLFGASVNQARKEETRLVKSQKNRLPSGWLGLDRSVYDLMVQTMGAGKWRGLQRISEQFNPQSGGSQPESQERKAQHEREVKALCHHIATEKGQLSFKKGDVLRVISKVDADWLLCGLGAERGLVPFTYVTHPEDEDY